jgi:hypothetical protein
MKTQLETTEITEQITGESYGEVSIRVVVLPRKVETADDEGDEILDADTDEVLPEEGKTPVSSYLERPKSGRLACVFMVNGQRQDAVDNSFIVQQLGFKYLRNRMMVLVDVDGLRPEVLGDLMQGSRQTFYKGRAWEALWSRLVATLKNDPDLKKLEEDAEAEVAELEAGDQKVKEALDTLIEAHHQYADHVVAGQGGEAGDIGSDPAFGAAKPTGGNLVSFKTPSEGDPGAYPVLTAGGGSVWLKPNEERELLISSEPANAWPALAGLAHVLDNDVPELHIGEERLASAVRFRLKFTPPADFDPAEYPLRTTLRVYARFNGFKEPRELSIGVTMKPAKKPEEPELLDEPTYIRVTTRQPVRLWMDKADTHVRLSWNGKDNLAVSPAPRWIFRAECTTTGREAISTAFSQPRRGRFSLLIPFPEDAHIGDELDFRITAESREGKTLSAAFHVIVVEREQAEKPEPRKILGAIPAGVSRRPPYDLKYVARNGWQSGTCWEGQDWTADDAAAFQEPTDRTPLTLIINKDMAALQELKTYFVEKKKLTENEISSRLQKYTSHVAYHLYQMYQAAQTNTAKDVESGDGRPPSSAEQRAEINRVAMTLVKMMEIAR